MMHQQSLLERGLSVKAMTLAVFAGVNAALPMYLWQSNVQLAMACFIVVSYTVWLWSATAAQLAVDFRVRHELMLLPMNSLHRRVGRMLLDGGFWWSLMFGCAIVTGSAWYVGIHAMPVLGGISIGWMTVAVLLNYGLTLQQPTTRCRKCQYQLASHFAVAGCDHRVRCPECGSRWSRADLGFISSPPAARRTRHWRQRRRTSRRIVPIVNVH